MEQVLAESLAARHFYATVLGLFSGLALLLAALGIYGVLAYDVAQRGREIAVRVALGAGRGDVVALVTRRAAGVAAAGLAFGLAGAVLLSRLMQGLVFEVGALDPLTLAAVAAAIGGSAVLATALPLRRALAVDPATALRGE
jgi:putative ABC transport system permease protein